MKNGPALEARDVRKRFGPVEALRGLSLSVQTGEIYGLLGPNGSGKTTFIRSVAGLVRPDAGSLSVLEMAPRAAVSAGRVGYMTQAAALYPELSIEENLAFFAALTGASARPAPSSDCWRAPCVAPSSWSAISPGSASSR